MSNRKYAYLAAAFLACGLLHAEEYIVSSLADSGSNTLRAAMLLASDNDHIAFDPKLSGTITLASSLPTVVGENLVISGPPSLEVVIDGDSQYQIFNILADNATIKNLTLNNGASAHLGGAVFVGADLSCSLSKISIASGYGANCQSPIYIDEGGTVNIDTPSFTTGTGPDISFVNASAFISNNGTLITPTIHIAGSGTIETKGPAPLNITAFSSPVSIILHDQSGTCTFSGTTTEALVSLGTVTGNFSAQYITDAGIIEPGPSAIGVITSPGDFTQTNTGNVQMKITSSGTNDLVSIQGNLYPSGTLTILPQPGNYAAGTSYMIFNVGGIIDALFGNVECPIDGFPFIVLYHPHSIEIVVTGDIDI